MGKRFQEFTDTWIPMPENEIGKRLPRHAEDVKAILFCGDKPWSRTQIVAMSTGSDELDRFLADSYDWRVVSRIEGDEFVGFSIWEGSISWDAVRDEFIFTGTYRPLMPAEQKNFIQRWM